MRPIFRTALVAAVLMLAACSSATPDANRAPTAVAPAASTVNDTPVTAPAQAQGKPRFIDFYATW